MKHAKKSTAGTCSDCGAPVMAGQGYNWIKPYCASPIVRHDTCRPFSLSERTSNEKMAILYNIVESIESYLNNTSVEAFDLDDAREVMDDAVMRADEVAGMYREAVTNIENGFGHPTEPSQEAEMRADDLEAWAPELRDALQDITDFEGDDEEREAWVEDAMNAMCDALGACPVEQW